MSTRSFDGELDVEGSEQLGEIQARLDGLNSSLLKRLDEAADQVLQGAWSEELGRPNAGSKVQNVVIASGPRIADAIGAGAAIALTGFSSVPLTGGLVPGDPEVARAFEFGAIHRDKYTEYLRTARGASTATKVKRRTKRQMPARSQTGWIANPAAKRLASRLVRLWQQTVVKFTYDAIDGGR